MLCTGPLTGRVAVVAGMLVLHFAKRVFEVLYVHQYSGRALQYCSPRHPRHPEPSFHELNGILGRGEHSSARPTHFEPSLLESIGVL